MENIWNRLKAPRCSRKIMLSMQLNLKVLEPVHKIVLVQDLSLSLLATTIVQNLCRNLFKVFFTSGQSIKMDSTRINFWFIETKNTLILVRNKFGKSKSENWGKPQWASLTLILVKSWRKELWWNRNSLQNVDLKLYRKQIEDYKTKASKQIRVAILI